MRPNCEKHPTRPGTYIAYDATGFAFRVTGQRGNWMARPSHAAASTDYRLFTGRTLAECSDKVGASRISAAA